MNSYELMRPFWDWAYDNPEKIKPVHVAIFHFAIEHCNRMGWKKKFGFPSQMTMEAIGVKSYKTYIIALNDLVDWGFIEMVERSSNQYSANIIALVKYTKASTKALDKALPKHGLKQPQSTDQSIDQSIASIDKPINNKPNNLEQVNQEQFPFEDFWNLYDKKVGRPKSENHWSKINQSNRQLIMNHIPLYKIAQPEKKYRKNPITYFNNQSWLDELITNSSTNGKPIDATERNRQDSERSRKRILEKLQQGIDADNPEGSNSLQDESY